MLIDVSGAEMKNGSEGKESDRFPCQLAVFWC